MKGILKKKKKPTLEQQIGTEIKREWKVLQHFKDENKVLFMALVWVVVAILVVNTIYVVVRHTDDDDRLVASTIPYANHVLTSQQTADTAAFSAHISNVYETDSADLALPEGGYTILVFDISVTNNTNGEQDLYPVNQFFVRDQEGGTYTPHASLHMIRPLEAAPLKSGQTVAGQLAFAVPKRLTRPLLYVDLGWNSQSPVVFDVLH